MKILFLTNVPSPYRLRFFEALGQHCALTVLFEKQLSSERDASWQNFRFEHFQGIVLGGKSTGVDQAFCPSVLQYLQKGMYDVIIVANPMTATGMLAIAYMKLMRVPYAIETDGGFPGSGRGAKEALKRAVYKHATAYFSTSAMNDAYFTTYGADPDKIIRYPFTSLDEADLLPAPPTPAEKAALRQALGIPYEKMLLSVGRFIPGKGYDVLLKACRQLEPNVGVFIIGGVPTEEYLRLQKEGQLANVHFIDFMLKPELLPYFQAADAFVLPTRSDAWGLVINEAMARALPVITTDRCIAGLELVQNDVNGYIVPVDDSGALADKLNTVLNDTTLRASMAQASLARIQGYTIEGMVRTHLAAFAPKT